MTEKDQAIRLLSDMRVRWIDAADGYSEAGIIYADQLLRDATDEIDNVRAVLTATKPKLEGCCDGECTGACDGNPSTAIARARLKPNADDVVSALQRQAVNSERIAANLCDADPDSRDAQLQALMAERDRQLLEFVTDMLSAPPSVTDEMVRRLRKVLKERWNFHMGAAAARDVLIAVITEDAA